MAEVFPELVLYRPTGEAETVRYHLLPVLLLNEFQRQQTELANLHKPLAAQAAEIEQLKAALRLLQGAQH